jgi:N-acylglucosamine-6-phosphate 2-epimerase
MSNIESVKGHLIVSCQALPDEPLHSSFIMGRMARAAKWGGAKGIRANTVEDINEICISLLLLVYKIFHDSCFSNKHTHFCLDKGN